MRPENKALAIILVTVVVVASVGAAYFLTAPPVSSTTVILAGTRFPVVGLDRVGVAFGVPQNGTLIGAWSADTTVCARVTRVLIAMIVTAPLVSVCGTYQEFHLTVRAGQYAFVFATLEASQNPPLPNGSAIVTVVETIQVVYP